MRYGSLCSGYGGLDLAVEAVFDAEAAWLAENDPDASKVLAHRWPDVPNVGDITAVGWADVEPVEVMCFGFPCQDLSQAGKGAGIVEGTRSGLWFDCLRAVRLVRPATIVVENVPALLRRRGGVDFNIVLSGLAESGYDVRWVSVRASDIGAPHRRERIFLAATDTVGVESERRRRPRIVAGEGRPAGGETPQRQRGRDAAGDRSQNAPYPDSDRQQGQPGPHPGRRTVRSDVGNDPHGCCDPAAHTFGIRREGPQPPLRHHSGSGTRPDWGSYSRAVTRWERLLGRPAPNPVDAHGRLNPVFVEWMMGLPAGWVTDLIKSHDPRLKLSRNQALRILGNGVVPAQAIHALNALGCTRALEEAR